MRHAFVVPRYGTEVVGGAEQAARAIAERLVSRLGWTVEVLTTCARDALTWDDAYPAGHSVVNGVEVHRFPSSSGRHPGFSSYSKRILFAPAAATEAEAEHWIELQGPVSPGLVEAVRQSEAESIAFYPYLYHPTVSAIGSVADRAVLHPAAHDEAPLYLPVFDPVFAAPRGLVFHTEGEQRLVDRRFSIAERHQVVLGLGVDEPSVEPAGREVALGFEGRPYLCCLGRVDDLKGTALLAEYFAAYKARRPGPLALALVGQVAVKPIEHPDIVLTGLVDEAVKLDVLRGATALVSPSPYESFSIVLMEAWSAALPVVVNACCEATREHCEAAGGGLWFAGYAQFEAVLDRLLSDPGLRRRLGERGRRYVDANFRWPTVIDRYGAFVERVLALGP